jgi:hypothetical protein
MNRFVIPLTFVTFITVVIVMLQSIDSSVSMAAIVLNEIRIFEDIFQQLNVTQDEFK